MIRNYGKVKLEVHIYLDHTVYLFNKINLCYTKCVYNIYVSVCVCVCVLNSHQRPRKKVHPLSQLRKRTTPVKGLGKSIIDLGKKVYPQKINYYYG